MRCRSRTPRTLVDDFATKVGLPRTTSVWFLFIYEAFWITNVMVHVKVENILQDPRVSLAIDGGSRPYDKWTRYLALQRFRASLIWSRCLRRSIANMSDDRQGTTCSQLRHFIGYNHLCTEHRAEGAFEQPRMPCRYSRLPRAWSAVLRWIRWSAVIRQSRPVRRRGGWLLRSSIPGLDRTVRRPPPRCRRGSGRFGAAEYFERNPAPLQGYLRSTP